MSRWIILTPDYSSLTIFYASKVLYLVGEADPFSILGGKAVLEKYKMNDRFFADVGHGINYEIADKINAILIEHFSK